MKTLTDQYDFSRPSLSGKYGFEIFGDDKKGLFYFHFNDKKGKALLFSQGYQSEKSRAGGMESVIKNAAKDERYHRQQTDGGQLFFVLKAGNYQEIARSRAFSSEEEMEKAIILTQTINKKTPVNGLSEETREELPAMAKGLQPFEKLSRYKFSMIFYPESRRWKVMHDFSGKLEHFDDLGGPAFLAYIEKFLPANKVESKALAPKKESWKEEISAIELVGEQKKWEGKTIKGAPPLRAEFIVPATGKAEGNRYYDARVFAHSLENASRTFIGEVEADLPKTGKISVPLHLESLTPGIYRIIAKVGLDEEGHKKEEVKGSRLIQVV